MLRQRGQSLIAASVLARLFKCPAPRPSSAPVVSPVSGAVLSAKGFFAARMRASVAKAAVGNARTAF